MALPNGVETTVDRTEEFLRAIQSLTRKQVLVGIPSSTSGRSGQINNAALGYIHEHGSPARNLPARPFLIPAVNRLAPQASALLQKAAEFALNGRADQAQATLEALGMQAATAVKNNILAGGDPKFADLALSTQRRKGTPYTILVETAQMLNAITYVVRDKSG